MTSEFVFTAEACELLGHPGKYHRIHYLVRTGQLQQIELSERKRYYRRDAIEAIARKWAPFQKRAA